VKFYKRSGDDLVEVSTPDGNIVGWLEAEVRRMLNKAHKHIPGQGWHYVPSEPWAMTHNGIS
jgi:hypothetical protein